MNLIAWIVGLALLGTGLYRLWREAQQSPTPLPTPAPEPEAAARAEAKPAPKPAESKPTSAAPELATVERKKAPEPSEPDLGGLDPADDDDITLVTLAPVGLADAIAEARAASGRAVDTKTGDAPPLETKADDASASAKLLPMRAVLKPDDDEDEERNSQPATAVPILYDDDASVDEPTRNAPWILVSAAAQTDRGRRRRRNEDSLLALDDHHLFVVADGMGGHAGGDVASKMAVDTIAQAFKSGEFGGEGYPDVPKRGAELALAIQLANKAIFDHARTNAAYRGMGTTVVSARFSPQKQRVYFGHVGDSRCYRLRGGKLQQVTTDHTMASEGIGGPLANHLNRAVGIHAGVKVDLIIARPLPDDVYLLCSDGLSKMVSDALIESVLAELGDPNKAVSKLVDEANANGGRDNITVVVVQVRDADGVAKLVRQG
jgi:protein phosphatase